jgi:tRNA 2-selenouridine synthase SelU
VKLIDNFKETLIKKLQRMVDNSNDFGALLLNVVDKPEEALAIGKVCIKYELWGYAEQCFLKSMEKGDISRPSLHVDIYERKQGVRIVRLMDRYEPHVANLNDDYALIKRAAENDKRQKTITNWINSKISNAYIRIDDDYRNCEFNSKWINTNN